jgi:hypothetical protein
MSTLANGGTGTSVVGYTNSFVYSTGVPLPQGSNQCLDGNYWALVVWLETYASGRGASQSISLSFDSVGGTGSFSRPSASSAGDTGAQGCSFLTRGGTGTFRISSSGSFYFGRGGSGGTTDNNGLVRSDGALYSNAGYYNAPTRPLTPNVSLVSGTSATLTWATPSDTDAGSGNVLTGYYAQAALDSAFTSGVVSTSLGVVTTYTFTGLSAGQTYYFRVMARNNVTDAASTYSLASTTVSLVLGTAPTAPATPTTIAFNGRIEVDWTDPSSGPPSNFLVDVSTDNTFATGVTTRTLAGSLHQATFTGLTPGSTYYARVRASNAIGTGPNSGTSTGAAIPARNALGLVKSAGVHVSGGVQVSLRSDGANSPTITLGYVAFSGTVSTFVSIATLPIDATSANHQAPGGVSSLVLVADPAGNLYVIGTRGDDGSTVLVKSFARTATTTWSAPVSLSQALPNTGDTLIEFGGAYVAGTGGSPVPSIFLLARRAGTLGAGALSYAVLSTTAALAGAGTLFLASGSDPSFMGAPPSSGANTGLVDVALLAQGGQRLALLGNSWAVVDVTNGVVSAVAKAADGANIVGASPWAQLASASSTALAVFTVVAGALTWSYVNTSGSVLGGGSYAGSNAFGGSFTDQWALYNDTVANVVRVFYVTATAGAEQLASITVSPATYANTAAVTLTSALGAATSTNGTVSVPEGLVDERRVVVVGANLLTGAKSTSAFIDTTGNVAPNAPSLVTFGGFDATQAFTLQWAVSDSNLQDLESAYEVQVQRVSDSVNLVATGSTAGNATSYVVAANTLANPIAYRWRVRTTDQLGTVGTWSAYSSFTTSALGTLTITSPTPDNVATVNVTNVPLVWTYSQVNGYTQTSYRVIVTKTSDGSAVSDTGVVTSTAGTVTLNGLLSGVGYTATLSIVTTAPGTPTVTSVRLITPSYAQPDVPTFTAVAGVSSVLITVTNPAPTGSRPAVLRNDLYRRVTGATAWTRVAQLALNGSYADHAVTAKTSYDYSVSAIANATPQTSTASVAFAVFGPALLGTWIFDPLSPAATEINLLFVNARTEKAAITSSSTVLQGRVNPLIEFGVQENRDLTVTVPIPLDSNHDATRAALLTFYTNRRTVCYRDGRGRKQWSAISTAVSVADVFPGGGSTVTLVLVRVDYDESV